VQRHLHRAKRPYASGTELSFDWSSALEQSLQQIARPVKTATTPLVLLEHNTITGNLVLCQGA